MSSIPIGVLLPVSRDRRVTITARWPLTHQEWAKMLELLETMRAGLVVAGDDDSREAREVAE